MVEEDVVKGRKIPNSVPEPHGWSRSKRCEGARGHEEIYMSVITVGRLEVAIQCNHIGKAGGSNTV